LYILDVKYGGSGWTGKEASISNISVSSGRLKIGIMGATYCINREAGIWRQD
jgi:hypothetical protein